MKKLIPVLLFTLVLAAGCDNSSEPENSSKGLVLNGQISEWPFNKEYYLSYALRDKDERERDTITHSNKTEIGPTGEFSFELYQEPDPVLLRDLTEYVSRSDDGYLGSRLNIDSLIITPSDVKIALAYFQVEKNGSVISSYFRASNIYNNSTKSVRFIYVDKDVRITGKAIQEAAGEGYVNVYYNYDVNLKKGWNKLTMEYISQYSIYFKNISEGKCVFSFMLFS